MIKKIILVDDDLDERLLFAEALGEVAPDIVCVTLTDCNQLLKDLRKESYALPDVIFMDINMPVVSGWDCLRDVKKIARASDIPVLMYSNSSHASDIEKAKHDGAAGFCTKARTFREMKTSLHKIIMNIENLPFVLCD